MRISDETFWFLAWLVRQDVTLPAVMVDYLEWDKFTKDEIKAYLLALNMGCIEAEKE